MKSNQVKSWLEQVPSHWHLVGVGGSGMSGLAFLLLDKGCQVSGSDLKENAITTQLKSRGLTFYQGHSSDYVKKNSVLVISSAIAENNIELITAKKLNLPIFHRSEVLATLLQERCSVLIAGMHGKTTTTALIAWLFCQVNQETSYYIGGKVAQLEVNAKMGSGKWFIAEGDESDGSLVNYFPSFSFILNVEKEHLDFYHSLEAIDEVFLQLAKQTKEKIFYCGDDPGACRIADQFKQRAVSFGLNEKAWVQARNIELEERGSFFEVWVDGKLWLKRVYLSLPGLHNVKNALGALALAREAGLDEAILLRALETFQGAKRRFEVKWKDEDFLVIDDYGHHPTEIEATLKTAKLFAGKKRLIVIFQPHRLSRTHYLKEDFVRVLSQADRLFLTEIYCADESPEDWKEISGKTLFDAVLEEGKSEVSFHANLSNLVWSVLRELKEGDVVLTLGAGNVGEVSEQMVRHFKFYQSLIKTVGEKGKVTRNEPLRKHTTLRVGGPAEFWCEPEDESHLGKVMRLCHQEGVKVTVIGRGSNLLIRDAGIRGVCLHLNEKFFSKIQIKDDQITADAGVKLRAIVTEGKRAGIGGFEFMEGIPASLGGALFMNAGAMGGWMFERVVSVRCMDTQGNILELSRNQIEASYRSVPLLKERVVLSAVLQGVKEEKSKIEERLKRFNTSRWDAQPTAPSAGCIFKNPVAEPAGKLIDELGLKNFSVGGARVSLEHGNFIVNEGNATAKDVLSLMAEIQKEVFTKKGIELENEVIILGEN